MPKRPAEFTLDITQAKTARRAQIRSYMLAVRCSPAVLPRVFEGCIRKHLGVESVGIRTDDGVRSVVARIRKISLKDPVNHIWIDKRAITGDPHNRLTAKNLSRLIEAVEYIVFTAAIQRDAIFPTEFGDAVIARSI